MLIITDPIFAKMRVISKHGNWDALTEKQKGKLVCSIGSEPIKKTGKYKKRDQTYILVTHRPNSKSFNVISVLAGYTFRKNSEASIKIGKKETKLFTDAGHAFAYDSKDDNDLVKSMIKGTTMIFKGISSRGTKTTDTYSLSGFSAAYKAINSACKVKKR